MNSIRIYDVKPHIFDTPYFEEVLRIQKLVFVLDDQGVNIRLINRRTDPEAFDANPMMTELLANEGEAAFPCTLIDDHIIVKGRFPSNEQLLHYAEGLIDLYGLDCSESECAACGKCGGHC